MLALMGAQDDTKTTALVTGANSGVGFETAFELARAGYRKVILGCRTLTKAEAARRQLLARGAADVFEMLAVDVSEVRSSMRAGEELLAREHKLDLVIWNAGTAGGRIPETNSEGIDLTFASTLVGHHVLTMQLLQGRGLATHGRIIIAGSEASRGDVLGMSIPDLDAIARAEFAGSTHPMLEAFARASAPRPYVASTAYAMAKLYAAWWAAELAPRLPKTVALYAVSPGNTPATNMGRSLPWPVRNVVLPMLSRLGPLVGLAHSVKTASRRYLDASRFGAPESGKFFASPPKRLTGPLVEQQTRWLADAALRADAYRVIVEMSGGLDWADESHQRGGCA